LIDKLWEEHSPRDPVNALHQRVSKLRRVLLEAGEADVLVSQGTRNQLGAVGVDVDAAQFTELLTTARRTGDPGGAVSLFNEALASRRGEPLGTSARSAGRRSRLPG
jgi:DNA-binding SARP family transcriptional activator